MHISIFRLHQWESCHHAIDDAVNRSLLIFNCSIVRFDIISVKTNFFRRKSISNCFITSFKCYWYFLLTSQFFLLSSVSPIKRWLTIHFGKNAQEKMCRTSTESHSIKSNQKSDAMKWNIQISYACHCHKSLCISKLMMLWLTTNGYDFSFENCGSDSSFRCNNR